MWLIIKYIYANFNKTKSTNEIEKSKFGWLDNIMIILCWVWKSYTQLE